MQLRRRKHAPTTSRLRPRFKLPHEVDVELCIVEPPGGPTGMADWQEIADPTTGKAYYYNPSTGATQ